MFSAGNELTKEDVAGSFWEDCSWSGFASLVEKLW